MLTFSQLSDPDWGRLGNQLFQIASTIGIAHENNQEAVFPLWSYEKYFAEPLARGRLPDARFYKYLDMAYKPIYLKEGDWDLQGFFTSEKYFKSIENRIRKQFSPAPNILEYINEKYKNLLVQQTCSIHVRRGDHLKLHGSFPCLPIEYYRYAMTKFPEKTRFVVFSDDISWCKENLEGPNIFFVENEADIIDLFIMSMCKDHIVSNSSFSWWGAWLNADKNKKVLCPTWWVGPTFSAYPKKYTKDLYANGFEAISLPDEKKWLINLYYFLTHPFYLAEYKIKTISHKMLIGIIKNKNINFLAKKLKQLF